MRISHRTSFSQTAMSHALFVLVAQQLINIKHLSSISRLNGLMRMRIFSPKRIQAEQENTISPSSPFLKARLETNSHHLSHLYGSRLHHQTPAHRSLSLHTAHSFLNQVRYNHLSSLP